MTDCKRKGIFTEEETHSCFLKGCIDVVYPALSKTCPKCNWKYCQSGHCGCNLSEEARYAIDIVYDTFCTYCKGD